MPSGLPYRADDIVRGDQTPAGRFAIGRWGGPTTFRLTSATVGTSVTRIVVNNARRVKLTLLNLGAVDVFISPSSDVTTSAGLKLVASTGTAESNAADDGEEVIGEVYAIASAAGNTVMISEVLRV
jgi:hypothetical protein